MYVIPWYEIADTSAERLTRPDKGWPNHHLNGVSGVPECPNSFSVSGPEKGLAVDLDYPLADLKFLVL